MEIRREASDKHKGITLQKLRAIKLAFESVLDNPSSQIHVAIEFNGDVFIYSDKRQFLEENKNYESKNFSFLSNQVLNTLVYFLDYWLRDNVSKSNNVVFSFYSTNEISKEYNVEKVKDAGVVLPDRPILELLAGKEFEYANLLNTCKELILAEYKKQYKGPNHNYGQIQLFTDDDWKSFFRLIQWHFGMPANENLKEEVLLLIKRYGKRKQLNVAGKEMFIEAFLRMRLEDNQNANDITQRFLTDETIELVFQRVVNQQISNEVYRFIEYDYSELQLSASLFASEFLKAKYLSVNPKGKQPILLKRKVKYHSNEVIIQKQHLEETSHEAIRKMDVVIGDLPSFVSSEKPTFLFGEIGSGKSSLISQFVIEENQNGRLSILVPVSYIKGKLTIDYESFFETVDGFVNSNIKNSNSSFNLNFLLLNQASACIVFDGLDELNKAEAKFLLKHLEKLSIEHSNIAIIATGRPLELQSIVNFNDWNCLTTVDLLEEEILEILIYEARISGMSIEDAITDAKKRLEYLNSRKELSSIAKTPLVVCLVRDYLKEGLVDQSFGYLMYKVLIKRLEWDESDLKTNYINFFAEYPNVYQREIIVSAIAHEISTSEKRIIGDERLYEIINQATSDISNRNKVVTEAVSFYKNIFLQEAEGFYSFTSQPLFEIAYAVNLSNKIRNSTFEFQIEDHNWRPLTFAVAIGRLKGYSEEIRPFLVKSITTLLFHEDNTTHSAAIVSESKDPFLAKLFIEKISELEFRPLRSWREEGSFSSPDSYSSYVIADTIRLAGEFGFDWFFKEYLDPIHPTHTGEESQIQYIIKNYFVVRGFQLEQNEIEKLSSIIEFHLAARTSACTFILPYLALVIPEKFSLHQRSVFLSDLLHHRMLHSRCVELLNIELNNGNKDSVHNALEIVCLKRERKENAANLFWLNTSEKDINKVILDTSIIAAAEGDEVIYQALCKRLQEGNLFAYLKYCALNNNAISDSAALLLYERFGERDFYLIARPLLTKTEWVDYRDEKRKKILDEILYEKNDNALKYMLNYIPNKRNNDAVPELYLNYFIRLLRFSEDVFKNEFLYVVSRLPEYSILSRYSEIREGFKKLITERPQYGEYLKQAQTNLDFRIRFNANCILLACFPEGSKNELETTIRSAHRRLTDNQEWIRFCMKLKYNKEVLHYIASILDSLPPLAKYYAYCILYHQNYSLTQSQKEEMIQGILGDGYYFDSDSFLIGGDGLKRIVEQPEFYDYFLKNLYSDNNEIAERAASILLSFHSSKLTKVELALVYILECENWQRHLYEFARHRPSLFEDKEFMEALYDKGEEARVRNSGNVPLIIIFNNALKGDRNSWIKLFEKVIYGDKFVHSNDLEFLYRWLKYLQKIKPELTEMAGNAAKELMTYPVVFEKKNYNSIFPLLAVVADEFSQLSEQEMESILYNYECHDEIACSLISRIKKVPTEYRPSSISSSYISIFSQNNSKEITKYTTREIEKILVDGDEIPKSLTEYMHSVLLYGIYEEKEISEKEEIGKLASYFFSVIQFCRNKSVDFKIMLNASDKIGWPFYRNAVNQSLTEALFVIKEIQINSKESLEKYCTELFKKIRNEQDNFRGDVIEYYKELFSYNVTIDIELLNKLFNELVNAPFYLNISLMYQIFDYISSKLKDEDYKLISLECEKHLKGLLSQYIRRGGDEENIPLLWLFSLIAFFVDKDAKDYSVLGFLKGLESIFIIKSQRQYLNETNTKINFKGRDLFIYSEAIYEKINPEIIKQAVSEGLSTGTPEIKAVCRILNALSGNF